MDCDVKVTSGVGKNYFHVPIICNHVGIYLVNGRMANPRVAINSLAQYESKERSRSSVQELGPKLQQKYEKKKKIANTLPIAIYYEKTLNENYEKGSQLQFLLSVQLPVFVLFYSSLTIFI